MESKVINDKLNSLSKSKFRSSFHLRKYMIKYIDEHGMDRLREDAYFFINNRISDTSKYIDGKQTPMKGHPVFIAQHATGCCCRGCLERIHHISKGKDLSKYEINYIVEVLIKWIKNEITHYK